MKKSHLVSSCLAVAAFLVPTAAHATDSDNDGMADEVDLFPCDAQKASVVFAPAQNQTSLLLFEDLWPKQGDLDFNDAAVSIHERIFLNAQGLATQLELTVNVIAVGAVENSGLALHLPVSAASVSSVSRTLGAGAGSTTVLNKETGENEFVVRIFENVREAFSNASGLINADPSKPVLSNSNATVVVNFATPVALNTGNAPFDVFLFRTNNFGHQIHLPQFAGTDKMQQNLFGSEDDGSTASRHFVDVTGLPFALLLPSDAPHGLEAQQISQLYPDIVPFAASGGTQKADFFTRPVINRAFIVGSNGLARPTPQVAALPNADLSCANTSAFRDCLDVLETGAGLTSGTYTIDPDGIGGQPAFKAYCDMETDNGGWTKIMYFTGARALTTNAVNLSTVGTALANTGKVSDADVNRLMGGQHEMLAMHIATGKWLVATWGSDWIFDETRPSGQRGGYCQDMNGGGLLRRWDGAQETATYRDAANLRSSYCWKFGFAAGGDGGIDLQNDGSGHSNASTKDVGQEPFAMFVRRRVPQVNFLGSTNNPAQSCKAIKDAGQSRGSGVYRLDPDGLGSNVSFNAFCEMNLDGGGWTKVAYFSAARSLSTAAISGNALGLSFLSEGKLSDADINRLMTGPHEMLALYPSDQSKWLIARWGNDWVYDETRPSGQRGGFCQDMVGGGLLRRWDGTQETATYRDAANLRSSYCWKFGFTSGGDGGIDLQNDGVGQSNASTRNVGQEPFVMFVR